MRDIGGIKGPEIAVLFIHLGESYFFGRCRIA
jgi:hypothetical protein